MIGAYFTTLFEGDIRSFEGNPFKTETPFGKPHTIGLGDVFAQRDAMEEALVQAEACMSIVDPRSDKAEYLRILGVIRAALATAEGKTP